MALIKLHFDGLSVSGPKICGLNYPKSTHGFKNQKEGYLGNVRLGPSQTPDALLLGAWWHVALGFGDGDSQDD